eukprot:2242818-Amphidinium_carterae.1
MRATFAASEADSQSEWSIAPPCTAATQSESQKRGSTTATASGNSDNVSNTDSDASYFWQVAKQNGAEEGQIGSKAFSFYDDKEDIIDICADLVQQFKMENAKGEWVVDMPRDKATNLLGLAMRLSQLSALEHQPRGKDPPQPLIEHPDEAEENSGGEDPPQPLVEHPDEAEENSAQPRC